MVQWRLPSVPVVGRWMGQTGYPRRKICTTKPNSRIHYFYELVTSKKIKLSISYQLRYNFQLYFLLEKMVYIQRANKMVHHKQEVWGSPTSRRNLYTLLSLCIGATVHIKNYHETLMRKDNRYENISKGE
jgi:hypothetical protein